MRLALLLALLLTGCVHRCETVAVIPNEMVVVHCWRGEGGKFYAIRWSELVGPWPVVK